MKRTIFMTTLVVLTLIFSFEAEAQWGRRGGGYGRGAGPCYWYDYGGPNLTQDQTKSLNSLRQAFWNDIASVNTKLVQKQLEFDSMMLEGTLDSKKATALQKEISDLQSKYDQKRLSYQLEARKNLTPDQISQLPPGCGLGFGNVPGGPAPGYGYGIGRGYGRGRGLGFGRGCWW